MTATRILSQRSAASRKRPEHTEELYANRFAERPLPVLNKHDFVKRYKVGHFGNASPTWDNYQQWFLDPRGCRPGLFHIRNRIAGGDTWYDVHWEDMDVTWGIARNRVGERNLYISEMAPHEHNLIQGEVVQGPIAGAATRHLYIWYSRQVGVPMREALRGPEKAEAGGIIATTLLRTLMCPNSWDWLNQLLDNFPGHVVEFSTFGVDWGTISNFNTCFWEVRGY